MIEIRIHGRGGQGVVTLGEVVAKCNLIEDKYCQTLPFFGVERRGANIKSTLRISDTPIKKRSMSYQPDYIVVFNESQIKVSKEEGFKPDTKWLLNTTADASHHGTYYQVDASKIAVDYDIKNGDDYFINVIMSAALLKVLEIPRDHMIKVIMEKMNVTADDKIVQSAAKAYDTVKLVGGAA